MHGIAGQFRLPAESWRNSASSAPGQSEAAANAQRLRDENELLRKCVKGAAATPGAFMEYLKMQGEI